MGNFFSNAENPVATFEVLEDTPYLLCIRNTVSIDEVAVSLDENNNVVQKKPPKLIPCELSPYLYLSDNGNAKNVEKLKSLGITHVFNVAGHRNANHDVDYGDIVVERRDAQDNESYPMLANHLQAFRTFVASARVSTPKAKVLVHCVAGVNRSGVLATALLMLDEGISVVEAVRRVREKRGAYCLVNECFQAELVALARREGLLGDAPKDAQGKVIAEQRIERKRDKFFGGGLDKLT
jgi:hypothetical protein